MKQAGNRLPQYRSAEELEHYLGGSEDQSNAFSFAAAVELDEREEYPRQASDMLDEWNFQQFCVPEEYGGKLKTFEELCALLRLVARRDPTVAYVTLGTFFGSINVWMEGTAEQKRRVTAIIEGNGRLAGGFTERDHGNDLLAGEVRAVRTADGYVLSGEKWPLTHATRSKALAVLARTDEKGGPRGFSMFLVEKDRLDGASYRCLPKLKTHGVRGADVSGLRFDRCQLQHDALIGREGSGLDLLLKFTQVTRTVMPAISLGAVDTALRATMSFALSRKLYGDTVFAIPHARRVLVDSFLDLLICECVAVGAVRSVQAAPEQMSVWAAVDKYWVSTVAEKIIANLAVVLGARYYLREGHWSGIFQKLARDAGIVSLGHVAHVFNLSAIAQQLRDVAKRRARMQSTPDQMSSSLESIFSLDRPLPAFDPKRLGILNHGRDDVTQGIELSLDRVQTLHGERHADSRLIEIISSLGSELLEAMKVNDRLAQDMKNDASSVRSAEMYDLARRHCAIHAAASCLHMWIHNRASLSEFFGTGEWLALSMERLLVSLGHRPRPVPHAYVENAARELSRLYVDNKLFSSLIPLDVK